MAASLPAYFTADLRAAVKLKKITKGTALFRLGQPVLGIWFVLSGELKALRPMASESEAVMSRSGAGEFFAESAIAASHYSCDACCVQAAEVAFIPIAALKAALADPVFSQEFFLANAINARRQCSRYERVRLRSARDRVLHLLTCETGPDGVLNWSNPLTDLAQELALEPETLYRVLSELENDRLISREKRQIRLLRQN